MPRHTVDFLSVPEPLIRKVNGQHILSLDEELRELSKSSATVVGGMRGDIRRLDEKLADIDMRLKAIERRLSLLQEEP